MFRKPHFPPPSRVNGVKARLTSCWPYQSVVVALEVKGGAVQTTAGKRADVSYPLAGLRAHSTVRRRPSSNDTIG